MYVNRIFCNFICLFVLQKKNRKHFKEKYLNLSGGDTKKHILSKLLNIFFKIPEGILGKTFILIAQNNFYNRLQELKKQNIEIPDIDYMNSIIFSFSGGLADQIKQFLFFYKNKDNIKNVKIIFNAENSNFILENYDIQKYCDYGQIYHLDENIIKLYNDSSLYNYSYSFRGILMKNNHKDNNIFSFIPPFIYKRMDYSNLSNNYEILQEIMVLKTPLNVKNKEKIAIIKNSQNSVCVHLRMGKDDIFSPEGDKYIHLYMVKKSYILKSIKKMINKIVKLNLKNNIKTAPIDITFFFFSNSMDSLKSNLNENILQTIVDKYKIYKNNININFDYVDINESSQPHFEIELMRSCNHFITSSGGFTELASVLGKYKDKIIIRPIRNNFYTKSDMIYSYKDAIKEWK
jgi:hypothetical protein